MRKVPGFVFFLRFFEKLWLGGAAPQTPRILAGGEQSTPRPPPLKRSFVTFDRGGQTGPPRSNDFFVGAADDTGAADDLSPAVRRPSTGRPTTVHGTNCPTEMILGFASGYACLGDLDKWVASRLQVACK